MAVHEGVKTLTGNLNDDRQTAIDAVFAEWDRDDSPGCALGVVLDGELVYARGYGMSNLEHDIPIAPDSIFHVASISKQFTALSIALLDDEGLLSLDDDVRTHLPELPDYGPPITIRNFVHHTSGVRDMWDLLRLSGWRQDDLINFDDLLDIVPRQKALNFQPGSEFLYSNAGYALLSVIVERVSGKTLRDFAHERIFRPLGMTRTHFHNDHMMVVKGRTQAYVPGKNGEFRISIPVFDVDGTTSLFTNVEDLQRWEANFREHTVGSPEVHRLILTPGELNHGAPMGYAFGLTHRSYRGVGIVEHSGSDAGYRAHFIRVPEAQAAVLCLCNLSTMNPRRLAERVLDICLADRLEPAPWEQTGSVDAADLEQWAGIYRNRATGDLVRIASGDDGLETGFKEMTRLVPTGENWLSVADDPLATFSLDTSNGAPVIERSLTYPTGTPQEFEIVPPVSPTPAQLKEYTGTFESEEVVAVYEIDVEADHLLLKRRRFNPRKLVPAGPDCFATDNLRLEFQRDERGTLTGFRASTMRVRGVTFQRT
jgi:CubicO group peptidase (beta-lactamase class C family)